MSADALSPANGRMIPSARMSDYTTFRLGGPCRAMVFCETPDEVAGAADRLRDRGDPFRVIGGGSNLLVDDEGLDEFVLQFATDRPDLRIDGDRMTVNAAVAFDQCALRAAEAGLAGLEFASGIPGTMGGAIAGNAGAFGESIADRILSLRVREADGTVREAAPGEFGFAYRTSGILSRGTLILEVVLKLSTGDSRTLFGRRDEILCLRRECHPDWRTVPTAGSFFKNIEPTSRAGRRQSAGWFLEEAGAKTMRVGGARTFARHANIIVLDRATARAEDVRDLARWMAQAVWDRHTIRLEPEVQYWNKNTKA